MDCDVVSVVSLVTKSSSSLVVELVVDDDDDDDGKRVVLAVPLEISCLFTSRGK